CIELRDREGTAPDLHDWIHLRLRPVSTHAESRLAVRRGRCRWTGLLREGTRVAGPGCRSDRHCAGCVVEPGQARSRTGWLRGPVLADRRSRAEWISVSVLRASRHPMGLD